MYTVAYISYLSTLKSHELGANYCYYVFTAFWF